MTFWIFGAAFPASESCISMNFVKGGVSVRYSGRIRTRTIFGVFLYSENQRISVHGSGVFETLLLTSPTLP